MDTSVVEHDALTIQCEGEVPSGGAVDLFAKLASEETYTKVAGTTKSPWITVFPACIRHILIDYDFQPNKSWNGAKFKCVTTGQSSRSPKDSDEKSLTVLETSNFSIIRYLSLFVGLVIEQTGLIASKTLY